MPAKTKRKAPPLTRRERRIAKEAEYFGLTSFSPPGSLKGQVTMRQSLEGMTDTQRNYYFDMVEDFCSLGVALRGVN